MESVSVARNLVGIVCRKQGMEHDGDGDLGGDGDDFVVIWEVFIDAQFLWGIGIWT